MDHAREFVTLSIGQIGAVDDPVIVGTTVETVLLSCTVGEHLSFAVFLSRDRVWLMLEIESAHPSALVQ